MPQEYLVREDVMTLISNLLVNRAAAVAAEADETYRGYYQDRSRAMYEMEMRSDLGDGPGRGRRSASGSHPGGF